MSCHGAHCIDVRNLRPLTRDDVYRIAKDLERSGLFPGGLFAPEPICEGGILLGTAHYSFQSADQAFWRTVRFTGALTWPLIQENESFDGWKGNHEIVVKWNGARGRKVTLFCKATTTAEEWTDAQLLAVRDALVNSGAFFTMEPRRSPRLNHRPAA
jgi:hypothetical protein